MGEQIGIPLKFSGGEGGMALRNMEAVEGWKHDMGCRVLGCGWTGDALGCGGAGLRHSGREASVQCVSTA